MTTTLIYSDLREDVDMLKSVISTDIVHYESELTGLIMDLSSSESSPDLIPCVVAHYMLIDQLYTKWHELNSEFIPSVGKPTAGPEMRYGLSVIRRVSSHHAIRMNKVRAVANKIKKLESEMMLKDQKIKELTDKMQSALVEIKKEPKKEISEKLKRIGRMAPFSYYTHAAKYVNTKLGTLKSTRERIEAIRDESFRKRVLDIYNRCVKAHEYLVRNHLELKNILDALKVFVFVPVVASAMYPDHFDRFIRFIYPSADENDVDDAKMNMYVFTMVAVPLIDFIQKITSIPKGNSPLSLTFMLCQVSLYKIWEGYKKTLEKNSVVEKLIHDTREMLIHEENLDQITDEAEHEEAKHVLDMEKAEIVRHISKLLNSVWMSMNTA